MNISNIFRLNWIATCRLNHMAGGWKAVFQMPVKVYGRLRLSLRGKLSLPENAIRGTLIIGEPYEDHTVSAGKAQLVLDGEWRVKGIVRVGIDCFIGVREGGVMQMSDHVLVGRDSEIRCSDSVKLEQDVVLAKAYLNDSTEHVMMQDGKPKPKCKPITVGKGALVLHATLLGGTVIPPQSVVAAGAVCLRDYSDEGPSKLLLAGVPASVKHRDYTYIL